MTLTKARQVNAWLLVVLFSLASCQQAEQSHKVKLFYPTGQLRVLATLRGDLPNGRVAGYRPTGSLVTTSYWVAGKRTGVSCTYYSNGTRQDSISFLNDRQHGPAFTYYRNGALHTVERYRQGMRIGTATTFDSLGHRQQQGTYDREGNQIYAIFYDWQGHTAGGSPSSIVVAKDTVRWGEPYTGSLRFGYPLRGKVLLLVGVLKEDRQAVDRWALIDTFQVVSQSTDGHFYFSYAPKRVGLNSFQYKFIQPASPWDALVVDSLSVDRQSGTHPFFVKKPRD